MSYGIGWDLGQMSQCNSCLCEVGLHKLDQRVRELCLAGLIPCTSSLSLSLSLSHTYPSLSLQGIVPCVTSDNLSLAKVALLALHSCNCETVTKRRGGARCGYLYVQGGTSYGGGERWAGRGCTVASLSAAANRFCCVFSQARFACALARSHCCCQQLSWPS